MHQIHANIWYIESKESFFRHCDYANESILFAGSHGDQKNIRWFFSKCYANWKENNHTVIFKSYNTPEYKHYTLAVTVKIQPNKKHIFSINKEITGHQHHGAVDLFTQESNPFNHNRAR